MLRTIYTSTHTKMQTIHVMLGLYVGMLEKTNGTSSAIAERPRYRVKQFWPKY